MATVSISWLFLLAVKLMAIEAFKSSFRWNKIGGHGAFLGRVF
jgi:hypothetical protein